jgi:hypothetical protein
MNNMFTISVEELEGAAELGGPAAQPPTNLLLAARTENRCEGPCAPAYKRRGEKTSQ